MKILKRNGEEIVFDTRKITEAIIKALDLFVEIEEEIFEMIEEAERGLYSVLHSLAHMLWHGFFSVGRKIKKIPHCSEYEAMCLVSVISTCVKVLSLVSVNVSCKTRAMYLLRNQDRGSSDSESGYAFVFTVA